MITKKRAPMVFVTCAHVIAICAFHLGNLIALIFCFVVPEAQYVFCSF